MATQTTYRDVRRGATAQPAMSTAQADLHQVRERINTVMRETNRALLPPDWTVMEVSGDGGCADAATAFSTYELQKNRRRLGLFLLVETTPTGLVRAYLGTQSVRLPIKSAVLPFGFEATSASCFGLSSARRLFRRLSGRLERWETIALLGSLT